MSLKDIKSPATPADKQTTDARSALPPVEFTVVAGAGVNTIAIHDRQGPQDRISTVSYRIYFLPAAFAPTSIGKTAIRTAGRKVASLVADVKAPGLGTVLPVSDSVNFGKAGFYYCVGVNRSSVEAPSENMVAAPTGSGQALVGAVSNGAGSAGASGPPGPAGPPGTTSPLTTKGDVWGYSTLNARIPVGTNGQALEADSTTALGVSYQWPGVGTLRTLKETVFAGITPTSYTDGNTYTIDGSDYTCYLPTGNGAVDMVAAGLRLRKGTLPVGTTNLDMIISPGATGGLSTILGEGRFRRGKWAMWTRMASYDYTNASGNAYGSFIIQSTYPKWGVVLRRGKSVNNCPGTATGGWCYNAYWNADLGLASYVGVATPDVWMAYFRTPTDIEIFYGTYAAGWPTMESMTWVSTLRLNYNSNWVLTSVPAFTPLSSTVGIYFDLGGAPATAGTFEIVFDRWRITAWE